MRITLFALLLTSTFSFSQILSVSNGASLTINSNSSVSLDGLELAPSQAYTISAPNSISRSNSPIMVGDNSSISRVYEASSALASFSGVISFSYLESELNDIPESNLVLEVLDTNGIWTSVTPNYDQSNNTLSYDFTNLASFSKITASSEGSTLSVDPVAIATSVKVYPNPTTDKLFISSNSPQKAMLFNLAGQMVLESLSTNELNVRDIPNGVYILNLENDAQQTSSFKIIKK
tara:strand:- start:7099 stop:7800 length:702 start_codon:yes stop_codon:yes gene_type:complete